ncbi:fimbrial biogenesis outer membrane usher protein [Yersinia sp. 2545 StPb PI]|uniref:fimbrial biogenesis outer membrane usher protein n=1 Tax=unclassified Yersinia (in: enterobacteria) TaxID=2653513 RepID=UPI003FA457DB
MTTYLMAGLVCISDGAAARTYTFDSAMLGGDASSVDIELFNQGGQLPGTYIVDILLNGERVDSREVTFAQENNAQGEPVLNPCLAVVALSRYGIRVNDYPGLSRDGDDCADLSAISQASADFQFHNQQLLLSVPHVAIRPKMRGIAPVELWDDGVTAALMNYRANTNRTEYLGNSNNHTDSQFVQLEPGMNLGAWRLRNSTTWQKSGDQSGKWQTPYTYAERGLYPLKSRLTLGERYTPSDIFDTVPFRGAMLGSDDEMVPYHERDFGPVVRGIARTQARVEVKQNGFTLYNATVAPGPFALTDLSTGSSGGNLEVTVWETDGSPQIFTVAYQTPSIALREGYVKYSTMAGQYRSADTSIEEAAIGQATVMYGLPWGLTAYGGAQGANHYQSASLGLGVSMGEWGAISVDGTHMQGERNKLERERGGAWRTRYSKVAEATNTSVSVSNTYYTSSGYHTLSEVLDTYRDGWSDSDIKLRKTRNTVTLSQSFGGWGYITLNGTRESYWNRGGHDDSFGASYGVGLGGTSLSLNWTQNKRIIYSGQQQNDRITSVMVSVPLGGTVRGNYQLVSPSSGGDTQQLGLSGQALDRQLNWNVNQRYRPDANSGDRNNSAMQLTWYGGYGQVGGNYSYSPNIRQMGANVAGGVVVHRNGVTLGQPLSDTVALVEAPGASGIPVGGWPGVKTDFRGYTTQSYLRAYQENNVSLDPSRLSSEADITQTDVRVVPTKGAVIPATFATRIGGRALMVLTRPDGSTLPFGAMVTLEDAKNLGAAGVVDDKGTVFLTGLSAEGELVVKWGLGQQQQCRVSYRLPKDIGPAGIFEMSGVCH